MPPTAALTPMPALVPLDRPPDLEVLEVMEGFEETAEVVVAMFQPLNGMAPIVVEELIASVDQTTPDEAEAKYLIVWPELREEVHA
jgi:hypothetical protein